MNKDSYDNLTELKPGDVIYINKPLKVKPTPPTDKEESKPTEEPSIEKSETPEPQLSPPPLSKQVKAPVLDIPLVKKHDPVIKKESTLPPKALPLPPQKLLTKETKPSSSTTRTVKSQPLKPAISTPKEPQVIKEEAISRPKITPQASPNYIQRKTISPLKADEPLQPPISKQPQPLMPPKPPIPQMPPPLSNPMPPVQPVPLQSIPPLPTLPPPLPTPLKSDVTPKFPPLPSVNLPIPPLPSLRQPIDKQASATTDLQGNLPAINAPQPVIGPPILPNTEAEPKLINQEEQESQSSRVQRGTRNLKIFGIFTIFIIMATIVVGVFFLWPKAQAIWESKRSSQLYEFEDVLVNLLQVENQELEIELTDSQIENVTTFLDGENKVTKGRIRVNNTLKLDYPADFSDSNIGSKYKFDLDLEIPPNGRDNLVLDVATVFTPENKAYFKLENLSINNQEKNLDNQSFANRWSNLEDLLNLQAGSEAAILDENNSAFLNYIANLLNLYSYPHYVVLLPAFNISQSQQYLQVKDVLLNSQAYELDSGSCKAIQDVEWSCKIKINYGELYNLYKDIYAVLDVDLPSYYDILQTADGRSSNLPKTIELSFDINRNELISLTVPAATEQISASSLKIDYKNFDSSSFKIDKASDPLDLVEYHRQILKYEEEEGVNIN